MFLSPIEPLKVVLEHRHDDFFPFVSGEEKSSIDRDRGFPCLVYFIFDIKMC